MRLFAEPGQSYQLKHITRCRWVFSSWRQPVGSGVGGQRLSLSRGLLARETRLVITVMWLGKPWLEEAEHALSSEVERAGIGHPQAPGPRQGKPKNAGAGW